MAEVGRPLKFQSVEELQQKIEDYFEMCNKTIVKKVLNKNQEIIAEVSKPYTITGLAEWLDTNRQTLINYEEREEYFDTIKRAKAKIEACYEERALLGDNNPVVSIFTLKNNFNWKDKHETDLTTGGEIINGFNFITDKKD
jgi:hypothetical protein